MTTWRWRMCPSCGNVERASDFHVLRTAWGANWREDGDAQRVCPHCGHVAESWQFQVVRERHPQADALYRRELAAADVDVLAVTHQTKPWTSSTSSGMYKL